MDQTKRAADLIYRGTRSATRGNLRMLGRMERCQRNPRAQWFVRWYDRYQAGRNAQRQYEASHPYSSSYFTTYYPGGGGIEGGLEYACGGSWHSGDYVVANAVLPCGTHVDLEYNGRRVSVVVRDRFGSGHPIGDFDLTPDVANTLGVPGSGSGLWRTH